MKLLISILLTMVLPVIAAPPPEDNQVVDIQTLAGSGAAFTVILESPVSLYDTPAARRVLATLPGDQVLTVLAMDKFGLQVRGKARNGPLTGWVRTQKVDLNDTLEIGTDTALLKVDVEVGRITAEFEQGVACSLKVNLEGVAPEVATVPAPVDPPFKRQTLAGISP